MKTIGQNISAYRKQKGLTQEGLAEAVVKGILRYLEMDE